LLIKRDVFAETGVVQRFLQVGRIFEFSASFRACRRYEIGNRRANCRFICVCMYVAAHDSDGRPEKRGYRFHDARQVSGLTARSAGKNAIEPTLTQKVCCL